MKSLMWVYVVVVICYFAGNRLRPVKPGDHERNRPVKPSMVEAHQP